MKIFILLIATLMLTVSVRADVTKANNANALELGSSYTGNTPPATGDKIVWNVNAGNNPNLVLNSDLTVKGLYFDTGLASDVTIGGAGVFTFSDQWALDATNSAKNLTINNNIKIASDFPKFKIKEGGVLTVNGTVERAASYSGDINFEAHGDGTLKLSGLVKDIKTFTIKGAVTINVTGTVQTVNTTAVNIGGFTQTASGALPSLNLSGNGRFEVLQDLTFGGGGTETARYKMNVTVSDDAVFRASRLYLTPGDNKNYGDFMLTQTGGTVDLTVVPVAGGNRQLGLNNSNVASLDATAVYKLNGGKLIVDCVWLGAGGVMLLNGGTLQLAQGGMSLFVRDKAANIGHVVVGEHGAIIDTNGKTNTVNKNEELPLEHDASLGAAKDGGLTVRGNGTLVLNKLNTYTGDTVITSGATLDVGADSKLGTGNIFVEDSGKLMLRGNTVIDSNAYLSFGSNTAITLNYNNTLTLAGLYDATADTWLEAKVYSASDLSAYGFVLGDGMNGSLTVLGVIPEPSTWLLLLSGSGLLLVLRQRRK